MGIDLTSASAREILSLNKKDVTKRLQVAVRDSQGGKRASWAHNDRPDWWKEAYSVQLHADDIESEVLSLSFASQGKSYWQIDRARVTLLLFEFRDSLDDEAGPAKEAAAHSVESPKLVKVADEVAAEDENSGPDSDFAPRHKTGKRVQGKQRRKPIARKRHIPQVTFDTSEDEEPAPSTLPEVLSKATAEEPEYVSADEADQDRIDTAEEESSTRDTAATTRPRRKIATRAQGNQSRKPAPRMRNIPRISSGTSADESAAPSTQPEAAPKPNAVDDGDQDEVELAEQESTSKDDAAEQARKERIAAIDAEEAEFRKQVEARLAEFRRKCKHKQFAMAQLYESQKTALTSAHQVFKMKNYPPRVLDMPMVEYVKEYNADAHERLLKDASRRAQRVFEERDFLNESSNSAYANPAPTPYAQARRDAVTATARKATRAARARQEEFAVPTTSLRSRPQRSAARTAATRIFQGSAIRRTASQSVRRTNRRPAAPVPSAMETPVPNRPNIPRMPADITAAIMDSIRKQPNPRAALEELTSNPAAVTAVFAELQVQLEKENLRRS